MSLLKNILTDKLQLKFRKRRFEFFKSLLELLDKPAWILDIGGTPKFWIDMGIEDLQDIHLILLNLELLETKIPNFQCVKGDARDLKNFRNQQFDVVFSNSVIEHLGNFDDQKKMADEVQRVGKRYFIQTPNYWFPIEPHYRALGFQYFPRKIKIFFLRHFDVGRMKKIVDKKLAEKEAARIRLLKLNELRKLFPQANLYKEKILILTKSFVMFKWEDSYKKSMRLR